MEQPADLIDQERRNGKHQKYMVDSRLSSISLPYGQIAFDKDDLQQYIDQKI
ncbi:hypothetical protein SDC9_192413 [bioreactor metagenome]|uniref:Uncharacterized protein n=1 Tax=bioreactor metagenome TaxID=1076179 RepID=A0A645I1W9_9ZZZZ